MTDAFVPRRRMASGGPSLPPRALVAIPVRNEAGRIEACLASLSRQGDARGERLADVCVVLLLNGCTDATWDVIARWRGSSPLAWLAIDGELAPAASHAGGARRAALLAALSLATPQTQLIATTDADSQVPPDWIERQLAALRGAAEAGTEMAASGCDVVAGTADISAAEERQLPAALRRRCRMEAGYRAWLEQVDAWLDPLAHDPWPRHRIPSGASLGFRPQALRQLQPLPAPPVGEDRALIERCRQRDLRIRFDADLRVTTSGRLSGRAAGGMADTLAFRAGHPRACCDVLLEPFEQLVFRAGVRARWRAAHARGTLDCRHERLRLGLDRRQFARLMEAPTFGARWACAERLSPRLAYRALMPAELPGQIAQAREWWNHHHRLPTPHDAHHAGTAFPWRLSAAMPQGALS